MSEFNIAGIQQIGTGTVDFRKMGLVSKQTIKNQ